MKSLNDWINQHEKLQYLKLCWDNVNNEAFRARVLGRSCTNIQLERNVVGPKSKDAELNTESEGKTKEEESGRAEKSESLERKGILYRIRIGSKGDGFFAEHRRLLNYLYYADQLQLIPYIEFTENYTYAEDHPVNGFTNPFEYYFCQPCVEETDVSAYRFAVESRDCDLDLSRALKPENGYDLSEEYVSAMAAISQKYIKPNKATQNLQQEAQELLGERKTLGIHVRLTDFRKNYYGHPTCVTADHHLELAKRAVEQYGFQRIFLATDDVETVEMFRKEFGETLLTYSDVIRSDGEVSVAFSKDQRENHHYRLGQEVLRDMYTLSMCDGLIAGKSQVSICAYIQKRTTGDYEYREIIDAGYNTDASRKFSDVVGQMK